jgi:hypothetical protein
MAADAGDESLTARHLGGMAIHRLSTPCRQARRSSFNDLARGVEATRGELDAAVARVLSSGWFVLGTEGQARA